jgi:hypothetical protein
MTDGRKTVRVIDAKLAADAVIYKGALCGFKAGYLVEWVAGDTAIEHPCIAIPELALVVDNTGGAAGDLSCPVDFQIEKVLYRFANDGGSAVAQAHIGGDAWGLDDQTVSSSTNGGTRSRVGTPWIVQATNARGYPVGVYVELEGPGADVAILDSLAAVTTGNGAAMVGIEDAGEFTAETEVEGALQEIYQHLKSVQGTIDLKPSDFYLLTGAPLAIFANGASAVPGSAIVDSKAFAIRWNDNATNAGIIASFLVPPDMDITANATLTIRASKTGATLADAVTFDVGVYNQVVGALHDADANYGGTTSAMTGDAAAKTIQAVTLTLALANLAASPASATITIKPTDGTLATADDLVLLSARITYKKKLLTS